MLLAWVLSAYADTITLDTGATIEGDLAHYEYGGDCQISVTQGDLQGVIVIVPCHRVASFVRTTSRAPVPIGAPIADAAPVAPDPVAPGPVAATPVAPAPVAPPSAPRTVTTPSAPTFGAAPSMPMISSGPTMDFAEPIIEEPVEESEPTAPTTAPAAAPARRSVQF